MGQGISTVVVEPRSLVREALVSLMASHSYRVVGGFSSTADIGCILTIADAPMLVILGALPADEVVEAASHVRKRWPAAKIVLLFDQASPVDFQKLLASDIDGCIPLLASRDTLVGTVRQIIATDLRILVLNAETSAMPCSTAWQEGSDRSSSASDSFAKAGDTKNDHVDRTSSLRPIHSLSKREEEILKSVVRGHSNKMIARACGITDSTIKVHMKSILRKIRVANRTQAAIWALEQGYGADGRHHSPTLQGAAAA